MALLFHLWHTGIVKPITGFISKSHGPLALIPVCTIPQHIVHGCTRFQLCHPHSSRAKYDEIFHKQQIVKPIETTP